MKAKLVIIALGAFVLMANGANAQPRTDSQTHVRHQSRIFGQARAFAPGEIPQYQSPGVPAAARCMVDEGNGRYTPCQAL